MPDFDPAALSDEKLLAMRASWEADRAACWQEVASRKGAQYQRAYEEFMASKREAEAAATELRRRGLVRRGRPPGSKSIATTGPALARDFASTFVTEQSARRLLVSADAHVRLNEKDRTALHAALRAGVARLRIEEGEILRAAFHGAKPTARTDVENLVLYNIALRSELLRNGVAFEHTSVPPSDGSVGYDYQPVPRDSPIRLWRPGRRLISWAGVPLPGRTAPAVWWTLRPLGQPEAEATNGEALFFSCRLATDNGIGVTELKAIVDGALAAAQWMPDPPPAHCELVSKSLAAALSIKPDIGVVGAALGHDPGSVLGPCADLVRWDGGINPDDHRLVAGIVLLDRSASTGNLLLEASICTADRAPTS